ncbi:MAG TPA: hypothetical protein VG847_12800, partial [Chitinophagaceae bacterium]|nr:hypothetical protein [Chitinophagaceae bacterium]
GALQKYLDEHPGQKGIFLETAHPVKFYDVVEPVTGQKVQVPQPVRELLSLQKNSVRIDGNYKSLKDFLLA